jgi:hypothetical protein
MVLARSAGLGAGGRRAIVPVGRLGFSDALSVTGHLLVR